MKERSAAGSAQSRNNAYFLKTTTDQLCAGCNTRVSRGRYIFLELVDGQELKYCRFCFTLGGFRQDPFLCSPETLKSFGIEILEPLSSDETALLFALKDRKSTAEIAPLLQANPGLVNLRNYELKTPLHLAVLNSDASLVKLLLSYNPPLEARCEHGKTPLANASLWPGNQKLEILQMLLDAGADINAFDPACITPLHEAVMSIQFFDKGDSNNINRSIEGIKLLLTRGASVNNQDISGNTPGHYCITTIKFPGVQQEILNLLIKHRLDVNLQDILGSTLLHLVVEKNMKNAPELIRILLKNGAKIEIKNKQGKTPLDIAISCFRLGLVEAIIMSKFKNRAE